MMRSARPVQTIFAAGEVNVVVWGVDDDVLGCNDLGFPVGAAEIRAFGSEDEVA